MKFYLSEIFPRIKKFSKSLDQTALLVDKPWVVAENGDKFEKLIFRSDGRVHLSLNGDIQDGKWEYLPEARSLIIEHDEGKKLYKHQYLDEAVLALQLDGRNNEDDYFLLANENIIPDADVKSYLKNKYLKEKNIELIQLDDDKEIEVVTGNENGKKMVYYAGQQLTDGEYHSGNHKLKVKNGILVKKKRKEFYSPSLSIWQSDLLPRIGDEVEGISNGKVEIERDSKYTITIENNRVANIQDVADFYSTIFLFLIGLIILIMVVIGLSAG